jgi:carbon starvation protein
MVLLGLGYIWYGRILERFFEIDPKNIPPSRQHYDGVDYVPAKNWLVLFGHHFSSIAGAGPIVGPIIAVAIWGWVPALLWIVFGSILIGGVHDFASLIISIRHKAVSISSIAEHVISKRSRLIFLAFVWLALILVIAVFTSVCSQTLTSDARTVVPCFGLIFIAVLVGYLLYWKKAGNTISTIIGLTLLLLCILLGDIFPINIGPNAFLIWCMVLLVYSFIASVTPVQILLQPRDYLSSFLLYFGIIMGAIGIFITHPAMNIPAFSKWNPVDGGWLWPMLFVTIACGANSGFHALVASGTTAKQLPNERETKHIGYGAMLLEAFLAVVAILVVSAGIAPGGLKAMLAKGGPGPIAAFGEGYGEVTKKILFGNGGLIAILILNSFILTTLDTATRITRYISQELFKINNRFFATFVVVFISGILVVTGSWNKIWPVFGASNQLVAALTFIVIASWLLSRNKSLRFVFLPGLFMLLTTIGALLFQILASIRDNDFLMVLISIALIILAILMVYDVIMVIRKKGLRCRIL